MASFDARPSLVLDARTQVDVWPQAHYMQREFSVDILMVTHYSPIAVLTQAPAQALFNLWQMEIKLHAKQRYATSIGQDPFPSTRH